MQNTVQSLLAYHLTNQPFYLGLIGFAASMPGLLLYLPAGVIIGMTVVMGIASSFELSARRSPFEWVASSALSDA